MSESNTIEGNNGSDCDIDDGGVTRQWIFNETDVELYQSIGVNPNDSSDSSDEE